MGKPGRGAAGAGACPGVARDCCKRASIAGFGGTTGRAAGWPARLGRIWARSGTFGEGADDPPSIGGADGPEGRCMGGRCGPCGRVGAGRIGAIGVPGRGPGETTDAGGGEAAAGDGEAGAAADGGALNCRAAGSGGVCTGIGWRGPEMICPGRPVEGAGRAGIGVVRGGAGTGCAGPLLISGAAGVAGTAAATGAAGALAPNGDGAWGTVGGGGGAAGVT